MTITYGTFTDASPTDPDAVWSRENTFFNNPVHDDGQNGYVFVNGSTSANYVYGKTTNISEVSGETITQVRLRFRHFNINATSNGAVYTQNLGELLGTIIAGNSAEVWTNSAWTTISEPIGGWTWSKVANLEMKVYATNIGDYVWLTSIDIEVTSEVISVETKTSVGSANSRIAIMTESDGTFNSRIAVMTESVGSFNALIVLANDTDIDVIIKASTNKIIQLKSSTNQIIKLKALTNKNHNIKTSTNQVIKLKASTNKSITIK